MIRGQVRKEGETFSGLKLKSPDVRSKKLPKGNLALPRIETKNRINSINRQSNNLKKT